MDITVRGRTIRTHAKHGNKQHYIRLYETYSDERLDELEKESVKHEQKNYKLEGVTPSNPLS